MTALTKFERLESQGSWRQTPGARLREVVVSVGDATLMLKDPSSEIALAHWSLPAVTRLNPGDSPAIYSPQKDSPDETLEIDDPLMIDSIERVHRAILQRRAHPGRLRGGLFLFAALMMALAAVIWLPDLLIRHAARIAPPAQVRAVGEGVLADITRSTGEVCRRESGRAVLNWITPKLLSQTALVQVVPAVVSGAKRIPGDIFVLGNDLLRASQGPEAAAGHLIAADLGSDDHAQLLAALEYAGFKAVLRLLTLGDLPEGALAGYGEVILQQDPTPPEDTALLRAFAEKQIPTAPYARSIDPTGASVMTLIEGDSTNPGDAGKPLLTDEQWLALQQICAG